MLKIVRSDWPVGLYIPCNSSFAVGRSGPPRVARSPERQLDISGGRWTGGCRELGGYLTADRYGSTYGSGGSRVAYGGGSDYHASAPAPAPAPQPPGVHAHPHHAPKHFNANEFNKEWPAA
ncbi:hypothetical protein EVAR_10984_1 [Eumeta japonica]|uniref:Uncharacterized protein n=1 Tax=Eumeta variegata TaxID=151549 RepID=A0A4C1U631_EUMVA|nr:hypothetical protein EVAR_10984_1 [Eumeta japonica]